MLEERLALLEGAEACRATATGMAAVHAAMLSHLKAGDRVVASRALFGSATGSCPRCCPATASRASSWTALTWRAGARSSPARPTSRRYRVPATLCWRSWTCEPSRTWRTPAGAIVVVDNVFATPLLQQPLQLGADVVVYSATKHMDGQGRVLGGAVLGRRKWIEEKLAAFHPQHWPGDLAVQRLGSAQSP